MRKLILYLLLLVPLLVLADNPPPPGLPDDPVTAPIDTNIFALFIAGILFGGYIIFKKNK